MAMRLAVLAACMLLVLANSAHGAGMTFEITVPGDVKPKEQDAYICTTLPLPDKPHKLVGVEPLGEQKVVHHILLFGEYPEQSMRCRAASASQIAFFVSGAAGQRAGSQSH